MRRQIILVALLVTLGAQPVAAANVLINNGLAPPTAANVLDHSVHALDDVYVRNLGCPPQPEDTPWELCPVPGAATTVSLQAGGEVFALFAWDTSHVDVSGGLVYPSDLAAYDGASLTLSGGVVAGDLFSYNDATVTMTGGEVGLDVWSDYQSRIEVSGGGVGRDVAAYGDSAIHLTGGVVAGDYYVTDTATITLVGGRFRVDGLPIDYGDLQLNSGKASGLLTGMLENGDWISSVFFITGSGAIVVERSAVLPVPAHSDFTIVVLVLCVFVSGSLSLSWRVRRASC